MAARILDGKTLAREIRRELKVRVADLVEAGCRPGLGVVFVGKDPASQVYVRTKERVCRKLGIRSEAVRLSAHVSEAKAVAHVQRLNEDDEIHGVLIQFPVPEAFDVARLLRAVDPSKDVDGLHPANLGRLLAGREGFRPCTPLGIMRVLDHDGFAFAGARAVIVGRSLLVGKTLAQLLLERHCTVSVCHSHTRDLGEEIGRADLLVSAAGQPELVRGDWIKPGAVVIDVGISRVDGKLIGDVEFEAASARASAITPVPGGIGPMTVAMLMENTIRAAERACKLARAGT